MIAVIASDIHFHPWSLFSTPGVKGVNSRLQIVIDELIRAAHEVIARGGNVMIIPGDVFHARGVLNPEVLNAVRDCFESIIVMGIDIYLIPGNHDLKSEDTVRLSSSIENLAQTSIGGNSVTVFNRAQSVNIDGALFGFAPWRSTKEALLQDLKSLSTHTEASEMHVFIHAGIDGVLPGIPSGGLTPAKLSRFGFRSVFAGHYHNHKDLTSPSSSNRIMSVGATTHHNWRDVDSRAGFIILDTDKNETEFYPAKAPSFVDITGLSETDMEIESAGNYVRFRGPQMTMDQINELRTVLKGWGALGVSIEVPVTSAATRSTSPTTGMTLDQSVQSFVKEMKDVPTHVDRDEIAAGAQKILDEVRAVAS